MSEQEIKITKLTAKSLAKVLRELKKRSEEYLLDETARRSYKSGISTLIKVLEELS